MKKKELIILAVLFVFVVAGVFILNNYNRNTDGQVLVEVRTTDNEVLMTFDIDINNTYQIEGSYGIVHIEVKDGAYRVYDVECPNKICEKQGWIKKGSIRDITCLPNNIYIVQAN